ncbi:hypothetical protein EMIHUDRAFT_431958, partial [Emiliania huxleyi CCMP1516]
LSLSRRSLSRRARRSTRTEATRTTTPSPLLAATAPSRHDSRRAGWWARRPPLARAQVSRCTLFEYQTFSASSGSPRTTSCSAAASSAGWTITISRRTSTLSPTSGAADRRPTRTGTTCARCRAPFAWRATASTTSSSAPPRQLRPDKLAFFKGYSKNNARFLRDLSSSRSSRRSTPRSTPCSTPSATPDLRRRPVGPREGVPLLAAAAAKAASGRCGLGERFSSGEHSSADVADRSSSSRGGGAVGGARTSLSSLKSIESGGEEASQPPSPSGLLDSGPSSGPSGGVRRRSLPRSTLKSTPRCVSPAISPAD